MSRNLKPWLEDYLLQIAREHGSSLSNADEHVKPKFLQIIGYLHYPNSHNDSRVWALCSDKDLKIPVCFFKSAMSSFTASQDPDFLDFGLRNQLRAVLKVRHFRLAFQRIPMPNGMTKENELFLQVEHAEVMASPSEEVFNEDNLVSLRKKLDLRRWIHGLWNGDGNILKREAALQKPTSSVMNRMQDVRLRTASPSQPEPPNAKAVPSNAAPGPTVTAPGTAINGSTSGPNLKERVRQREERAAARRRARFSKSAVTDGDPVTPRTNDISQGPRAVARESMDSRPRPEQPRASTSTASQRTGRPPRASEVTPLRQTGSKPPSRRVSNALLSDDPTPVRLLSRPPFNASSDGDDDDDEPAKAGVPRQTTPSDWAATQIPARSSPDPIPSSDDWMRSSPPRASPPSPPPRSRHPAPVRASSSSTSHASTTRARSPKSSTGSLTMQGKRHTAEPPPVPPPGTQEKVLVPNSDTSLSQSQEKKSEGRAAFGKEGRTKRDQVETSERAEGKGKARRNVNGARGQKRKQRDIYEDDELDGPRNVAVDAGAQMPGHFSPTGESEAVEDLIMPDVEQDPTAAHHPRLYPDLKDLDEDDRQVLVTTRRADKKGKGRARETTPPADNPSHNDELPRSPSPATASHARTVDLPTLLKKQKRPPPRRSSNFAVEVEPPAKRPRNADGQAQVPDHRPASRNEHADAQPTAVQASTSHVASSSAQESFISWVPENPRISWWTRHEDARALAIIQEGSALIEQRRQQGRPPGRELSSQERRKYFQVSGRTEHPSSQ
ncbi:unnamed protein product [Peniophora sp. CBMAI 1063]|nr:unnamed protein product [Peniophora sp. CBMAI 1063]